MKTELGQILQSLPTEVEFKEISKIAEINERILAVGALYANTIGVNDRYIEFCPDNEPPLAEEKLSWIWFIKPYLGTEIQNHEISDEYRLLVTYYYKDKMNKFWDLISE